MGKRANGEGSIYFDKHKGRWVAAVCHEGRRHKVSATTKREAAQKRLDLQNRLRASPSKGNRRTVKQLLLEWSESYLASRDMSASTVATYHWSVEKLVAVMGATRLERLNLTAVEAGLRQLAESGLSKSSLTKVRSVLNQACEYGRRREYLRDNPVTGAIIPSISTSARERTSLTVEQSRQLLTAFRQDRLHAYWLVTLMMGLRPGEARSLYWEDWDESSRTLAVRRSVRYADGAWTTDYSLKNAHSRRTLAVPEPVTIALGLWREQQRIELGDQARQSLIFTTRTGNPIHLPNVRRSLKRLTAEADVPDITTHELRHTAASLLAHEGVPAEQLADVLGHHGTRTTINTYRHVLAPAQSVLVAPIERLFS